MTTKKAHDTAETVKEEVKVQGSKLVDTVKNLIKEGNVRSITIKNKEGKTLVKFPLTIGVVGAALAPVLAAVGAIAALVTESSITIEREKK
jgi:hypothetical protein